MIGVRHARAVTAAVGGVTIACYTAWLAVVPNHQVSQGYDFGSAIWGPIRGLAAGFNPYQPGDLGYLDATGQVIFGSLHAPSLLVVAGPLSLWDQRTASLIWVAISAVLLWAAAWILMRPVDARSSAATITLGLLLTLAGPGDYLLRLGQVTGVVVLGFSLLVRWPDRWAGAAGIALMLVSPQIGVPMSVLALGDHRVRTVARGWALTAALSLPPILAAAIAARGLGSLVGSIKDNLAWTAGEVNAANRIDVVGVWGGGPWATLLLLGLVVGVALWWSRSGRKADPTAVLGAATLTLLSTFAMPYSLCLVLIAGWPLVWDRRRWGVVERVFAVLVVVAVAQTLVLIELLAGVTGVSVVGLWRLLGLAEHVLLLVLLVVVLLRLGRSRAEGGAWLAGLGAPPAAVPGRG